MVPSNERSAKRQKRAALSSCGSARITLDVGGTTFTTSSDTLTSNSTYFASLFRRWSSSSDSNDDYNIDGTTNNNEIFIDQDPEPFRILLAYMRRGQIRVDDIDESVLSLAEFLGIDQLLLAVKIRWYCNIGTGPIIIGLSTTDEDIAIEFDKEHGGIRRALSSGLFPYFRKQDDVNAEKDLATLSIFSPPDESEVGISICEIDQSNNIHQPAGCLVGALTGLHAKGYTVLEELDKTDRYEKKWTFSRRRHSQLVMNTNATDILIPSNHEGTCTQKQQRYVKQFALLLEEMEACREITIAPALEHHPNPCAVNIYDGRNPWLEEKGFINREEEYEELFQEYIKSSLNQFFVTSRKEKFRVGRIYSRKVRISTCCSK